MSAGWVTLLVTSLLFALVMLVWNLFLMRLLDIAKHDVARLAGDRQPVKQAISIMEGIRTRPLRRTRIPEQRQGDAS